ncbi:MAG: efflux RND transporter periplasmic adaptor subunit [Gemmatimonadales bacterium]
MPNRSLALLLVGLAACSKAGSDTPASRGRGMGGPVPVEVVEARSDTVVDAITATGQIEALQAIELRPEVDGRLVEIMVREGAEVAQGAPLFKVDDGELAAQVARAEADRDLADQALARTRQLLSEKAAAPADVERAEASARSARAQYELLKLRLDRTVVRAPFTGVAGQRLASLGDYVNTSTRLITLQTVNPQRAVFQVPERYAERLALRQQIAFRVAALTGREFRGTVDFVDPRVELPGRTITVKALVQNPKRELQAGMFLEVRLETDRRPNATVIPEDAVIPAQAGNVVWVVNGEKVDRRPVELGVRTPGFVEVRGVEPGEMVVVGGAERLNPASTVKATVVERTPARAIEPTPKQASQ